MGLTHHLRSEGKCYSKKFGSEVYSGRTVWTMTLLCCGGRENQSFSQLSCITIPRYFMGNTESSSSVELHGFGDASTKACGAEVYIRCVDEAGHISTHHVMSKSRVALTKTVSLPRLELLAAFTNARLLKFVAESLTLKIDRVVCWTDSMVTLQRIRGSSC